MMNKFIAYEPGSYYVGFWSNLLPAKQHININTLKLLKGNESPIIEETAGLHPQEGGSNHVWKKP